MLLFSSLTNHENCTNTTQTPITTHIVNNDFTSDLNMEIPLLHYKSFSLDQIKSRCTFPFSFPDNKVVLKQLKQRTLRSGCFLLDRRKWRNPFDRIRCSSLGQNLQPRPRPKPSRIEEIESDVEETPVFKIPSVETCSRIVKFVILGRYREALELFEIFEIKGGFYVDSSTYDALVSACIRLKSIRGVKRVFSYMVSNGYEPDQYMRNRVLLMHVKCGMMLDARKLFDEMPERNLVTWNTMIGGLLDIGDYVEAFRLFLFMWAEFSDGGPRTFASMIRASAGLESISAGMQLHACTVKMGLGDDVFVSCALIDMYSKSGSIEDARFVFEEMPEKTTVAWNTVIAGYALHGYSEDALELYCEMRDSGVKMDHFTFSILVRICSRLASMEHARQAHAALIRHGFGSDMVANTSLVDFYSKWGRIEDARHVFDKMASKNVLSWNALIAGYGNHGRGADAIELFECMVRERITPTHVTFLAVLSACCYSGLSECGWEIFQSMGRDFKVKPRAMHYACMIELLGREGLLDEAFALIRSSPFKPTANMWAALLTASRVHENLELAKLAAERLYGMGTEKLNNYIVLLNIYNSSGQLKEAAEVVQTLRKKGMRMHQACSWIEVKRKPHVFLFGDKTHIQTEEIYQKVDSLILEISRHGYVPEKKARLPDVDKNEERMLKYHSEKLAIAFGLLNTPHWQSLQVVQGHRICDDCHKAIKLIAKVTKREIVVRDGSRFHRFKNGSCSCGDYW